MQIKIINQTFKFTLLDILFIFLGLLVVGFIAIFFVRQEKQVVVRFRVTDDNPLYAYTNPSNLYSSYFKVGDIEQSETGKKMAEIVHIENLQTNPDQKLTIIDVSLKAIYNPRKKVYYYKGRPLVFGERHIFEFSKIKTEALSISEINDNENESLPKKRLLIKAQLSTANQYNNDIAFHNGVAPFIASEIDSLINNQTPLLNSAIESISVERLPMNRVIPTDLGTLKNSSDPFFDQLLFTIIVDADEINQEYYLFQTIPLKVGNTIPLNWNTINAFPTITSISII